MSTAAPHPQPSWRPSARGRAFLLMAYVFVYGIACALPALHLEGRRSVWSGAEVMVLGPFGLQLGHYAWLANIASLASLWFLMNGRFKGALTSNILALLLSLQAFWLPGAEIVLGEDPFNRVRVVSLGIGCYLWMAALAVPLAAALLMHRPTPIEESK